MKPIALLTLAFVQAFAVQAQTRTYLDPRTGRNCVQHVDTARSASGKHVVMRFRNTCDRTFDISIKPANAPNKRGTGIGPGKESTITCEVEAACQQGTISYK